MEILDLLHFSHAQEHFFKVMNKRSEQTLIECLFEVTWSLIIKVFIQK